MAMNYTSLYGQSRQSSDSPHTAYLNQKLAQVDPGPQSIPNQLQPQFNNNQQQQNASIQKQQFQQMLLSRQPQQQQQQQQYAPDHLGAALFSADPVAAQSMFTNATVDMNTNFSNGLHDSTNESNAVLLDLLANDFASSIASATASGDMFFVPPSPGRLPPDFSKVQQISDQYNKTGDAPYIASAALFHPTWDNNGSWSEARVSQPRQNNSKGVQQQYPFTPVVGSFNHQQRRSVPVQHQSQQQAQPQRLQQHLAFNAKPGIPAQQTFPQPVKPVFQVPDHSVQIQPKQVRPTTTTQSQQSSPQLQSQNQSQQQNRDSSLQLNGVNWLDLQAGIMNSGSVQPSSRQAMPPNTYVGTPVSNLQSPMAWAHSPASGPPIDGFLNQSSPPTTAGFHVHQRASSFPVQAGTPQVVYTPGGPVDHSTPAATQFSYPSSQQQYSGRQRSEMPTSQSQMDDSNYDLLDFERSLDMLSRSIDKEVSSHYQNNDLKTQKPKLKRKETTVQPKKTKEQIQADKEERSRARTERLRVQKEKAEAKKAAQAVRRAQEERVMKEIRENLARQEVEQQHEDEDAAKSDGSEKRFKTNDGHSISPSKLPQAPEVSLGADTPAEFLYAQRQLNDAFVPPIPVKPLVQMKNSVPSSGPTPATDCNTQRVSMSPFVYNVKQQGSDSNSSFTPVSIDSDSPMHSSTSYISPIPAQDAIGDDEDMVVNKTPAPTQAMISAQSSMKSVAVPPSRLVTKKVSVGKSKLQGVTQYSSAPALAMQHSQSQPKFSSPPNATPAPANHRPGSNATAVSFDSLRSSQPSHHRTLSQEMFHSVKPQPFTSMSNLRDSGSSDKDLFMSNFEQDLQDIFASNDAMTLGFDHDQNTFQNAQNASSDSSSREEIVRINGGMLDEVMDKVEEWSKSLKWNIDEEATRLGKTKSTSNEDSKLHYN
ncbi:hypothetical protein V1512DRAFT_254235 [Lipomyces arxii]|uniref:uncharacterized protein n=1 Tax=Lipomyces arxii TaxID=56418 RepID=UPI0034CFBA26